MKRRCTYFSLSAKNKITGADETNGYTGYLFQWSQVLELKHETINTHHFEDKCCGLSASIQHYMPPLRPFITSRQTSQQNGGEHKERLNSAKLEMLKQKRLLVPELSSCFFFSFLQLLVEKRLNIRFSTATNNCLSYFTLNQAIQISTVCAAHR